MDPNSDLVGRYFAALAEDDIESVLTMCTEDVVVDRRNSNAPWGRLVSTGHAEFVENWRGFQRMWEDLGGVDWEMLGQRPLPGGRIAVETRIFGRGPATGLKMDARGAWLVGFERGLVSECTLFQSLPEAELAARRRAVEEARLYFVCEAQPNGGDPAPLLEAALRGGADVIQLREKAPRCAEELLEFAVPFARAARAHGALFILNDRPDLVGAAGADGVHVGQDDEPVAAARAAAGPAALVGLSTHSARQLAAAVDEQGPTRPDQVSVGPVWETATKPGRPATGLELIRHAAELAPPVPWFAIGGIDTANVAEVAAAGARRIVVVRAIRDAPDPEAAARELRAALDG